MNAFLMGALKLEREVKQLGSIAKADMVQTNGVDWLLPRINPACENCGRNDDYNIDVTYTRPFIVSPWGMANRIYRIVCPECRETIELDAVEYAALKPCLR